MTRVIFKVIQSMPWVTYHDLATLYSRAEIFHTDSVNS